MHAEYEAGLAANPGKVPVYVCRSVKPINGSYGVNYEPIFSLSQWVDRSRVPDFDNHAGQPAKKEDPISTSPKRMNGNYPAQAVASQSHGSAPLDDQIPF